MSKQTKIFGYAVRYFNEYYKKDLGELIIEGKGYYYPNCHEDNRHDDDIESLFGYDIERILWNMQDITKMYHAKHMLDSSLIDAIEKPTLQHMEWIFRDELAQHYGEDVQYEAEQDAHTDLSQHIDFPNEGEVQEALRVIRLHSKQQIIQHPKTAA